MAEFDDLLAGIRTHPHDELRRLVFADWLDENAHANPVYAPWASYIRWAIAATRTPRTHPDYWTYRRYPEKPPDGVAKLLGVDWLPMKPEWSGGFPDCLRLHADTLNAHDRRIAEMAVPIRRLVVWLNPDQHGPLHSTRWVGGETMARSGALDVWLDGEQSAPVLAALSAAGSPPLSLGFPGGVPGLATFARQSFPALVGLAVPYLDDPDLLATQPDLIGLRRLTISGRAGRLDRSDRLTTVLPKLERLNLDQVVAPCFLRSLARGASPALTHLEMDAQTCELPGWTEFAESPAFSGLTRLSWRGGQRDISAPVWPADSPEPDAGELILNVAHLGSLRTVALFASPLLHRCECLFVENCELTPEAYLALAENPSARNLKVLSVQMPFKSEPFARGEPVAALCRSPHLAGLTELSLTFHDLYDDDFDEVLCATFADGLRYLNLAGSYFSERLLERLTDPAVLPALTWLDIHAPTNGSRRLEPALQKRFGPHFAL